ncbi:MAG: hypothetical protein Q7S87_04695 [Agitococcus sp.]|nr:hypothetical protein [Agitococcus sp.]
MQCTFILSQVRKKLNDPNATAWTDVDALIPALNEALQALASYRPDAASITAMMLLVAGTRQTLPSNGVRLLKVIRNRGVSGLSDAGRAIRKADMLIQDSFTPDWHEAEGQTTVDEYFYDPLMPKEFYVYPPAPVSPIIGIDISYVRVLPTITASSDTLPVDDYFAPALQEWMLYSIWCGDDEQNPNYAAANAHLQTFFNLLQIKTASDMATNPKAVKAE